MLVFLAFSPRSSSPSAQAYRISSSHLGFKTHWWWLSNLCLQPPPPPWPLDLKTQLFPNSSLDVSQTSQVHHVQNRTRYLSPQTCSAPDVQRTVLLSKKTQEICSWPPSPKHQPRPHQLDTNSCPFYLPVIFPTPSTCFWPRPGLSYQHPSSRSVECPPALLHPSSPSISSFTLKPGEVPLKYKWTLHNALLWTSLPSG